MHTSIESFGLRVYNLQLLELIAASLLILKFYKFKRRNSIKVYSRETEYFLGLPVRVYINNVLAYVVDLKRLQRVSNGPYIWLVFLQMFTLFYPGAHFWQIYLYI